MDWSALLSQKSQSQGADGNEDWWGGGAPEEVEQESEDQQELVLVPAADIINNQRHVSIVEGDMRNGDDDDDDESLATPKADEKSRRSSTKSDGDAWMNLDVADDDSQEEGADVNALVEAVNLYVPPAVITADTAVADAAAPTTSTLESNATPTISTIVVAPGPVDTPTSSSIPAVSVSAEDIINNQRHVSIVEGDMRNGDDDDDDESLATPKADEKSRRSSTKSDGDAWMNLDVADDDSQEEGADVNALVEAVNLYVPPAVITADTAVADAAAPTTSTLESNATPTISTIVVAPGAVAATTEVAVTLPVVDTTPPPTTTTNNNNNNSSQEIQSYEFEDPLPTAAIDTPAVAPFQFSTPRADTLNTAGQNTGTPISNQKFDEFFDLSDDSQLEEDLVDAVAAIATCTLILTLFLTTYHLPSLLTTYRHVTSLNDADD